jgi:tetratricopeptide (TPR) repeat protein
MARFSKIASLFTLFAFVFLPLSGLAATTGAVGGTVRDAEAGHALEGVRVRLISERSGTMSYELRTDKKGYFYKGGLVPGPYRIAVEKEGYVPQEKTIRVALEETTGLDIRMAISSGAGPAADSVAKTIAAGSELLFAGKYAEAMDKFSQAVGQAPSDPVAYFFRAAAGEKLGDGDTALADYGKAIALKPDFILCYARSGIILAKAGEFGKAADFYQKAVELGDKDPSTHYNYGVCLVNLGRGGEARGVFENVLVLDPGYADACYQLGIIHIGSGETVKARELLEKFVALDPQNKNVLLAKEILKSLK